MRSTSNCPTEKSRSTRSTPEKSEVTRRASRLTAGERAQFLHLLTPYSRSSNWPDNASSSIRITENTVYQAFDRNNFKVFSVVVPANVVYFSMSVKENNCFKLQSFVSVNSPVLYQIERNFGHAVSLDLEKLKHDLREAEIKLDLEHYKANSEIDFTNRLLNFRLAHDILKEPVKINFFCAYWAETSATDTLAGHFDVMFQSEEDNESYSSKDFAAAQKDWLNMASDMMLYEVRLYASEYDEILSSFLKFEKHESDFTKNVPERPL